MNVFITGATGYIGQQLVKNLLQQGTNITALCRAHSNKKLLRHPHITIAEGDLSNVSELKKSMSQCDRVYHLAAYASVWSKDKSLYWKVNVEGTRTVLEAARMAGIKKMVFTSTAGVLGPAMKNNESVNEDTERKYPFFNDYERTKWEAEQWCKTYAEKKDISVVIVNPSRVYGVGKESESNAVSKLIQLFLKGKWKFIPGDGKQVGNYAYLDNVVCGIIAAMEKGQSGERYILGGENISYKEFFLLLRKLSGSRQRLYNLPVPVMMAFATLESLKAEIFNVRPLITPDWVKKYLYNWPLTSAKAECKLGYSVTPFLTALGKTIEKIQSENS